MSISLTLASRERYCHACFKPERPLIHVNRDERYGMTKIRHRSMPSSSGGTKILMTNILELLNSGVTDLTLNIKGEDLLTFADSLIAKAKEQLLPVMVSAAKEQLLSKKEVLEKFNVCPTTLWNWSRSGYLIPVKIGRKVSYRQADIERLIIERGSK